MTNAHVRYPHDTLLVRAAGRLGFLTLSLRHVATGGVGLATADGMISRSPLRYPAAIFRRERHGEAHGNSFRSRQVAHASKRAWRTGCRGGEQAGPR